MATDKQIEFINKLSKWKAVPVSNPSGLSEEQASALIDELKKLKSVAQKQKECLVAEEVVSSVPVGVSKPRGSVNSVRLGLAIKLVWQFHSQEGAWPLTNKGSFNDQVLLAYEFFEKIEHDLEVR